MWFVAKPEDFFQYGIFLSVAIQRGTPTGFRINKNQAYIIGRRGKTSSLDELLTYDP